MHQCIPKQEYTCLYTRMLNVAILSNTNTWHVSASIRTWFVWYSGIQELEQWLSEFHMMQWRIHGGAGASLLNRYNVKMSPYVKTVKNDVTLWRRRFNTQQRCNTDFNILRVLTFCILPPPPPPPLPASKVKHWGSIFSCTWQRSFFKCRLVRRHWRHI